MDAEAILDALPAVIYVAEQGTEGHFAFIGSGVREILGVSAQELLDEPELWAAHAHPDDKRRVLWRLEQGLFCDTDPAPHEYRMVSREGRTVWISDTAALRETPDGGMAWHGVLADITARKTAELNLERDADRKDAVAKLAEMALSGAEGDQLFTAAVGIAGKLGGVERSFVWEKPADGGTLMLRAGLRSDQGVADWRSLSAGPDTHAGISASGGEVNVPDWRSEQSLNLPPALVDQDIRSSLAVPIPGKGDSIFGVLDVHSAVAGRFDAEDAHFLRTIAGILSGAQARLGADEELRRQVLQDPLTGLPNRLLFVESVDSALRDGFASGTSVAVIFLDIDRFKLINDSLGHHAGDDLLSSVAPRLRRQLRPGDSVARFGGDEFGVLVREVGGAEDADAVAERIARSFDPPFVLAGSEHFLSVSMGLAIASPAPVDPEDAEELIRNADAAMYRAKDKGRARWERFDHAMKARAVERLEVEQELRRALDNDELILHYQPIVSLPGGSITGTEALVRWRHPERGLLQPGEFIPVAEESGLIEAIGAWVQEQACMQVRAWHDLNPDRRPLDVSVNLSARQVARRDIARTVSDVLARTGLDPHHLRLEITETVLMDDSAAAAEAIDSLHRLGVRLALDDFGTGYSSLAYLHQYPFDSLKVDRSFVEGLGTEPEADGIVRAIIGMARALGLDVVGEGVETAGQLAELNQLGCDYAQGYLFARPLPPEEVTTLLEAPSIAPDWTFVQ